MKGRRVSSHAKELPWSSAARTKLGDSQAPRPTRRKGLPKAARVTRRALLHPPSNPHSPTTPIYTGKGRRPETYYLARAFCPLPFNASSKESPTTTTGWQQNSTHNTPQQPTHNSLRSAALLSPPIHAETAAIPGDASIGLVNLGHAPSETANQRLPSRARPFARKLERIPATLLRDWLMWATPPRGTANQLVRLFYFFGRGLAWAGLRASGDGDGGGGGWSRPRGQVDSTP